MRAQALETYERREGSSPTLDATGFVGLAMSPLRFVGGALARHLAKPRPGQSRLATSPPELLAAALQPGDVLLVEGTSRFSSAIKYLTQSTWSHTSLYLGDRVDPFELGDDARVLVDADIVEGVRLIPLKEFSGLHTRICRPVGLGEQDVSTLIAFMLDRVGNTYDLKNVFDLARYFVRRPPVPGAMRRRALAMGSGEPTRGICSTLIAQAFGSIRYPILPEVEMLDASAPGAKQARAEILHIRHHSLYAPRDFDVSPFFRIVKPRIEHGFEFRSLNWADPAAATD